MLPQPQCHGPGSGGCSTAQGLVGTLGLLWLAAVYWASREPTLNMRVATVEAPCFLGLAMCGAAPVLATTCLLPASAVSTDLAMGKHEAKQAKLSLENKRLTHRAAHIQDSESIADHSEEDGPQMIDSGKLPLDVKS
ncbi:hypothetical protein NDU88_003721 [Pleurodeles waltl]|uniref:Uncharacterized protein n=1 Tax=Pleurodeles waltl TaxID=8319 RepID=A0AAV7SGS5_PLEWA|nr:hypothetical protein NDU88_003721 [Pleurodeles waltl]